MKKILMLLSVTAVSLISLHAFAQITVTSSKVMISQPLTVYPTIRPLNSTAIVFDFEDITLLLGSLPTGIQGRYSILPSLTNRMDLGGTSYYFNNAYIKQIYTLNNPLQISDFRLKENVRNIEDVTTSLMSLRPVTFDFKHMENVDESELRNKVGFIAQEVQEIFPYLVHQLPDTDIYGVEYTSLIPYIVKGFQEEHKANEVLRKQVEDLQEMVDLLLEKANLNDKEFSAPKKGNKNESNTLQTKVSSQGYLFQNTPNPFSETTVIRYSLNESASRAVIRVRDMQGKTVYSQQLSNNIKGQVEISAGNLTPGIYTYSLVVDGKVVDSKKMIVTE